MIAARPRVTRLAALFACAALVACSSSADKAGTGAATVGNVTPGAAMPTVRTASDITTNDGQVATVVGTYEVEPVRRGSAPVPESRKHQGIVYLKLDDGTSLRVGNRPEDERLQFLDQRVEIDATVLSKPPPPSDPRENQMSPMPTLVDVTAVRPAS
jgi:hypothetical protein